MLGLKKPRGRQQPGSGVSCQCKANAFVDADDAVITALTFHPVNWKHITPRLLRTRVDVYTSLEDFTLIAIEINSQDACQKHRWLSALKKASSSVDVAWGVFTYAEFGTGGPNREDEIRHDACEAVYRTHRTRVSYKTKGSKFHLPDTGSLEARSLNLRGTST